MAEDGVAIHGFTKSDTKGWSMDMKSLVKGLFPLVYSEKWDMIAGNHVFANRIVDRFRGIHTSQIKDLASHIDFLNQEPVVSHAWDYIVATVEKDDFSPGDEVLGESEKEGPGEMLVLSILCKLAVINYIWDNVQAGVPDGDVPSVSTLTNLLLKVWKLETRAVTVKMLMKVHSKDGLDRQLDPLTALMEGRGLSFHDKVTVPVKKLTAIVAPTVESTAATQEAQKLQELQRANDRLKAENEVQQRLLDEQRRASYDRRGADRGGERGGGRGGYDRDRGGGRFRGGGRGGHPPGDDQHQDRNKGHHPALLHPGDTCTKCHGAGHKADSCPGVQGTIKCSRCGGTGHRVLYCTSPISN